MNESIYNLIPIEYEAPEKKPLYRKPKIGEHRIPNSTFGCHGSTRPLGAGRIEKKEGALFGPPPTEFRLTQKQLNLANNIANSSSPSKYESDERRPRVPKVSEKPIMGVRTNKNFITANAVEAILQVPNNRHETAELNYMKKEDFGKVPKYLDQVKEEIRRENDMIQRYLNEQMGVIDRPPEVFEQLSNEDREDLIIQLKKKWASVNAEYQKITHLVVLDNNGLVKRKENFEQQLTQLDNDIQKLQKGHTVLIKMD